MKKRYCIMFLVLVLSQVIHYEAAAQKCLVFGYDADGNRISRTISDNCMNNRDLTEEQEAVSIDDLVVYPNPTEGSFRIIISEGMNDETSYYKVCDMNGMVLFEGRLYEKETEVDLGDCHAGVYLLKVTHGIDVMSKMILKQ